MAGSARIVDVAREAGVSPKTVSNFLHDHPHMSEQTRAKVAAAVRKLNYRPNVSARMLRGGRVGTIGLAVPGLKVPYFAELAGAMAAAAEARGYTLLIDQTGADAEHERRAIAGFGRNAIDGLVLQPDALDDQELATVPRSFPLVVIGERAHPPGVPYVGIDNVAAARAATEHLLRLGRRDIAFVGTHPDRPDATWSHRVRGFTEALAAAGLDVRPDRLVPANGSRDSGAEAVRRLLVGVERPDALFCYSDLVATGALLALHEAGVRVPDDIAVLGWDDIAEASFTWPPLTSLRADTAAIARHAIDAVLRQAAGEPVDPLDRYVDFRLVERASTLGDGARIRRQSP